MRSHRIAVALLLAVAGGWISCAAADGISPDPAGGDDYAAITNAIAEAASSGGVAKLNAGTFHISQTISIEKSVTLHGAGKDETIITPTKGGFGCLCLKNASCEVTDLTVKGFSANGAGVGINVATGGTIRRCHVTQNKSTGGTTGIGVCLSRTAVANAKIYDSVVDFNKAGSSTHGIEGAGIYSFRGYISGCLVVSNEANTAATGYYADSGLGGGIAVLQGTIINTTVADNNQGGIYFSTYGGDRPSVIITNCVVSGNTSGGHTGDRGPDIESFSNGYVPVIYQSATGSAVQFADAENGDYRLSVNSAGVMEGAGFSPYDTTSDTLGFYTEKPRYVVGSNVTFYANLCGSYKGASCTWTITDGAGHDYAASGNPAVVTFDDAAVYSVTLTAGGTSVTRTDMLRIVPSTVALAVGGSLADALALAADGQVIQLADGTHEVTGAVTLDCNVTVKGNGYGKCTIKKVGDVKDRVAHLCAKGAVLEGVTVTGGRANDFNYCWGGGIMIDGNGGTVRKCRITGNGFNAGNGRGGGVSITVQNGLVSHCVIDNNTGVYGGGAYLEQLGNGCKDGAGRLETCLVVSNTASCGGGIGVDGVVEVRSCTVSDNTASSRGGGICHVGTGAGSSIVNCLFVGDTADNETSAEGKPEWSQTLSWWYMVTGAFSYCGFQTATKYGTGSIDVTNPFMDRPNGDYTLVASTPAKDAGTVYDGIPETDLAGNPRIMGDGPDMGCYEYDTSKASCDFSVDPTTVWINEKVTLTPVVIGGSGPFNYSWVIAHENGDETHSRVEKPELAFARCGKYSVSLVVSNETVEVARQAHADVFTVYPHVVYVKPESPGMSAPYDSWETAHTNIHELMESVTDGCTIMIGAGTNVVTNVIDIATALTFSGEDRDRSWVWYSRSNGAKRVFRLNHPDALVENVTIANGNGGEEFGGGVLIDTLGGTVQDCRITGNGTSCNSVKGAGVGLLGEGGYLKRCVIDRNYGSNGHGSHGGLGIKAGHVENCLVYSNVSHAAALYLYSRGGTVTISNCTFACNVADTCGAGGARIQYENGFSIVNCIFAGNTGKPICSECMWDYSWKCVRTDRGQFDVNELDLFWGGGYNFDSVQKCAEAASTHCHNCCFGFADSTLAFGTSSVNTMPQYVDKANCDFHLKHAAPANRAVVSAGRYEPWMTNATDLNGKPRVKRVRRNGQGLVDMGCYESVFGKGGLVLLVP